jgi:hypothetical protein
MAPLPAARPVWPNIRPFHIGLFTPGDRRCNEFAPRCLDVRTKQTIFITSLLTPNITELPSNHPMMLSSVALLALGTPISLNKDPYHVEFGAMPSDSCLNRMDIHRLTGSIADSGGNVSVTVDNKTIPDYSIAFAVKSATSVQRSISAEWSCNGKTTAYTGRAYISSSMGGLVNLEWVSQSGGAMVGVLEKGPNPPPPPPPPPQCADAHNKTACDAVPSQSGGQNPCSWCASSDGVHR